MRNRWSHQCDRTMEEVLKGFKNPAFHFLACKQFWLVAPLVLLLLVCLREALPHLPAAVAILMVGFWLEAKNAVAEERRAAGLTVERKFWGDRDRKLNKVTPKRKAYVSAWPSDEEYYAEEFFNRRHLEWFDEIQEATASLFEDTALAFESSTDSFFSDDNMSSGWMDD